jgi:hypothetical protein
MALKWGSIRTPEAQKNLSEALSPLIGTEISNLKIPVAAAAEFEPSQIGTIVGTLVDAMLPHIAEKLQVGLSKNPSILGAREGYPDYFHSSGYRLELKGLFKDNLEVTLKKPPTPREPSARLTQKVTVNNVRPDEDALLIVAYQLAPTAADNTLLSPVIVDLFICPVIDCVYARDHRLSARGGKWFGDFETPGVLSKSGKRKVKAGQALNADVYGRKESEGHDYNEDTNFGKLKRIPHQPIQEFLAKHGAAFAAVGTYPQPWRIVPNGSAELLVELDDDDDD